MSDPRSSGNGLSFGTVARRYDSVRPDYPERLIDAVLEYAGPLGGSRALEIGAGTGQATAQFAWRGIEIDALEPSPEMVDLILARFEGTGHEFNVTTTTLESAELEPSSYGLVYCASAWHWLEPRRRWEIVADALCPGGTLAVLFHIPRWRETSLRPALDALYRAAGAPLDEMGPTVESIPTIQAFALDWLTDAPDPSRFDELRAVSVNWAVELSSEEYVELLSTYGDHIALDPHVREQLFTSIVDLVDGAGGLIELRYSTFLLMAKYLPDAAR